MESAVNIVVLILASMIMLVGLIGTVVPVLPGVILIFVAAFVYALVEGFHAIGWPTLVVLGLLTVMGATADLWASSLGAKMGGASGWSVLAGLIGSVAGLLLFNLPGAIVGAVVGVLLAEIIRLGDPGQALKAGSGWVIGWVLSTVVHLSCGLVMIAIFVWQVVQGA